MKTKNLTYAASLALMLSFSQGAHACLGSEQEPNDSESSANSGLCSDTVVSGNLNRNDIDWYQFFYFEIMAF